MRPDVLTHQRSNSTPVSSSDKSHNWPATTLREAEVRSTLEAVLLDGETPDPRTGVLVALLNELGQALSSPRLLLRAEPARRSLLTTECRGRG